jgi:hypothetical protein
MEDHIGEDMFDVILCNNKYTGEIGSSQWVRADQKTLADSRAYCTDLVDDEHPRRHDSLKLAQAIKDLFDERTGPLRERGIQQVL